MHSASVIIALSALVAGAWAGAVDVSPLLATTNIIGTASYPAYHSQYSVSDVLTGDHKSASETRDGDVTKGSYSLLQPDGVIRTVNYISTPLGGFQAQVINSGAAAHPAYIHGKGRVGAILQAAPVVAVQPAVVAAAPIGIQGVNIGLGKLAGLGLGHGGGANSIISTQFGYGQSLGLQGGLLTSNGLGGLGLVGNQGVLVTSHGLGLVGAQSGLVASNEHVGTQRGNQGGSNGGHGQRDGAQGDNNGHGSAMHG